MDGKDDFGVYGICNVPPADECPAIGFVLRLSTPDNGWADREIGDRVLVRQYWDTAASELWLVQGESRMYRSSEEALRAPRITEADHTGVETVMVRLNVPYQETDRFPPFELVTEHGASVEIIEVEPTADIQTGHGGVTFAIRTKKSLSLDERYTVSLPGYRSAQVSPAGLYDDEQFRIRYHYDGNDLGSVYTPSSTSFRVWSPLSEEAQVVVYEKWDSPIEKVILMERSAQGTWTAFVEGDLNGVFYMFRTLRNGEWTEASDPYATAISVNGRRAAVIDLRRTNPEGWHDDRRPPLAAPTDAVIYELHVRDATIHAASGVKNKGRYAGLTESGTSTSGGIPTGLDYIAQLGVTHVQLLPVADYASVDETRPDEQYNWGYDPQYYFAPEGSYATDAFDPACRIKELKTLIQAMHRKGLRVVLDVVYNHVYAAEPSHMERLVPGYYFRYNKDGSLADGSGVGNDTASERSMVRKLIVDSVCYWAREYHIDGFRFDLMGIHDIDTMNEVRRRLNEIDPSILVYGEGWDLNTPLPDDRKATMRNAEKLPGVGMFHDAIRDGIKGGVFHARERGFVNGEGLRLQEVKKGIVGGVDHRSGTSGFALQPEQTVNFAEVHDNHTLWDKLALSNSEHDDAERLSMHRLATAIILCSQGIPFIHAGQEWFRTKVGHHNSYRSPDAVNAIDWGRVERHWDTVQYVRGLIALRRSHSSFRLRTAEAINERLYFLDGPDGILQYKLLGRENGDLPYDTFFIGFNPLRHNIEVTLPQAVGHEWVQLVDGSRAGTARLQTVLGDTVVIPALQAAVWAR